MTQSKAAAKAEKDWIDIEFEQLDLGDKRLNKRAKLLMQRLAADPTASIPQACNGWSETIGAYRLLSNDSVDWQSLMAPHWQRTQERISKQTIALCIQDTTELNFNGQDIEGLGPLSYESQRGMYLHPTYVVTPDREPLGVTDAWMWSRQFKDAHTGKRPGIKESTRWVEGYQRIAEMAPEVPNTRLVYLADREADLMPLMKCAQELGTPADWLIRAKHNRCLPNHPKLWEHTTESEPVGQISFTMPSRKGIKARQVTQQIWIQAVDLPAGKNQTVQATCLVAREQNCAPGHKAIEWRLLTNRAVQGLEQATELIDWYRARWEIEIFFNILKNACQIEALQLSCSENLQRTIALFMVVAWRIAHLMRVGRACPDLPAQMFFDEDEIRVSYLLTKKVKPDKPKVNEVLRLIARLGGFLGRKGDGEPGVKTIWEGLAKVSVAAMTLQSLRAENQLVDE